MNKTLVDLYDDPVAFLKSIEHIKWKDGPNTIDLSNVKPNYGPKVEWNVDTEKIIREVKARKKGEN